MGGRGRGGGEGSREEGDAVSCLSGFTRSALSDTAEHMALSRPTQGRTLPLELAFWPVLPWPAAIRDNSFWGEQEKEV